MAVRKIASCHRPVEIYSLVADEGIAARIASIVGGKKALFDGLFDGSSDAVKRRAPPDGADDPDGIWTIPFRETTSGAAVLLHPFDLR